MDEKLQVPETWKVQQAKNVEGSGKLVYPRASTYWSILLWFLRGKRFCFCSSDRVWPILDSLELLRRRNRWNFAKRTCREPISWKKVKGFSLNMFLSIYWSKKCKECVNHYVDFKNQFLQQVDVRSCGPFIQQPILAVHKWDYNY